MKTTLRHTLLPLVASCLACLMAGCATTQVHPPPPAAPPAQFKEAGGLPGTTAATPVPDDWWTLFQDPVLDHLESRLLIGNESLKSLVAAVESARAADTASRSAMAPTLSLGAGATRSATPTASTPASARNPANSFSLTASASWEIDLWGRLSQASTGAQARLQASRNDLAAARLSAQALLAQTYFALRTADAQQALLARTTAAYQRSLELTQARLDGGVAARSDVLQAQTQLNAARAQAADLAAQRAQLEHAIAVLLGEPPAALDLPPAASLPAAPEVPAMLPSTLLARRPDIAAAQQRVKAAFAQIGVADAAFFPDLALSASAGLRGAALSRLVSGPGLLWSVGASLAQAVLDGGQRQLASDQARAAAVQAGASYRQTVLTALQEVEDNLVLASQLQREAALQLQALQSAQQNLQIVQDQYRAGTVGYLNVVTAQTSALSAESALLTARNRQLAAVNTLLKNIAGRWDRPQA